MGKRKKSETAVVPNCSLLRLEFGVFVVAAVMVVRLFFCVYVRREVGNILSLVPIHVECPYKLYLVEEMKKREDE